MPVAPVASQPGGLKTEHRPDTPAADGGDEPLEAGALDEAGARAPEILVDDLDGREPHRAGRVGERVLPALALGVLDDLPGRRLADVDDGTALAMFSRDLGIHPRLRWSSVGGRVPRLPAAAWPGRR
ncbi:MAG TPA: hypothetical protein VGD56_12030 [Gemmatirosa sp.]